eukprot:TRINITY_DN2278_c0_g1_i2.p1 TRINITY_DN2278_c0_g1~~TRINITY_DN2278_c0_g1_i2.p1  ORF type:complete len:742 (-),score=219.58 TRINITY_DN2278_c0_g1_i2:42-2219(-)
MEEVPCDNFTPQIFKKTTCQNCFLPQAVHSGQEVQPQNNSSPSISPKPTSSLFEAKMKAEQERKEAEEQEKLKKQQEAMAARIAETKAKKAAELGEVGTEVISKSLPLTRSNEPHQSTSSVSTMHSFSPREVALPTGPCSDADTVMAYINAGKEFQLATSVKNLNLEGKRIADEGCELIAKMLTKNRSLQVLNLAENSICNKGAIDLAEALRQNKFLNSLDISGNYIGGEGIKAISDAMTRNTTLHTLSLEYNSIDNTSLQYIADFLKVNTTFKTLNLNLYLFNYEIAEMITTALEGNNAGTRTVEPPPEPEVKLPPPPPKLKKPMSGKSPRNNGAITPDESAAPPPIQNSVLNAVQLPVKLKKPQPNDAASDTTPQNESAQNSAVQIDPVQKDSVQKDPVQNEAVQAVGQTLASVIEDSKSGLLKTIKEIFGIIKGTATDPDPDGLNVTLSIELSFLVEIVNACSTPELKRLKDSAEGITDTGRKLIQCLMPFSSLTDEEKKSVTSTIEGLIQELATGLKIIVNELQALDPSLAKAPFKSTLPRRKDMPTPKRVGTVNSAASKSAPPRGKRSTDSTAKTTDHVESHVAKKRKPLLRSLSAKPRSPRPSVASPRSEGSKTKEKKEEKKEEKKKEEKREKREKKEEKKEEKKDEKKENTEEVADVKEKEKNEEVEAKEKREEEPKEEVESPASRTTRKKGLSFSSVKRSVSTKKDKSEISHAKEDK